MIELATRVAIEAPVARVWATLAAVERWPEWTSSVRRVERLDPGPLGVGARVRIEQPRLRPATWTVTEWHPEQRFIWVSAAPGVVTTALHAIATAAGGSSEVTLAVRFEGLLAPVAALLARRLTNRYLGIESAGLKARCESLPKPVDAAGGSDPDGVP